MTAYRGGRIAAIVGAALALIVAVVVVMSTLVLPRRAVELGSFADSVGGPGATTSAFSDRSIVGALAYGLAGVTSGRVDDFWARIDDGEATGLLTLHLPHGRRGTVSVDVVDTDSGRSDLAPCRPGPRCTVTTLSSGATLTVSTPRHPVGPVAVLTDPARHLQVHVQAPGRLLTAGQVSAVASAGWWATGAPRGIAAASRWLKVGHMQVAIADWSGRVTPPRPAPAAPAPAAASPPGARSRCWCGPRRAPPAARR